jgi:hypothetical protein
VKGVYLFLARFLHLAVVNAPGLSPVEADHVFSIGHIQFDHKQVLLHFLFAEEFEDRPAFTRAFGRMELDERAHPARALNRIDRRARAMFYNGLLDKLFRLWCLLGGRLPARDDKDRQKEDETQRQDIPILSRGRLLQNHLS